MLVAGTFMCKMYRLLESVGRALSTLVQVAMAYDRFARVVWPHRTLTRRCQFAQLAAASVGTLVLLSPLLIWSHAEEIVLKELLLDHPPRLARVRVHKCVDRLEVRSCSAS